MNSKRLRRSRPGQTDEQDATPSAVATAEESSDDASGETSDDASGETSDGGSVPDAGDVPPVPAVFEKGQNVDAEGRTQKVSIRATSLFRKEDGRWKMIGHHSDLLTFLAE